MRWQQLFDDLQSQFEAEEAAAERAESASRVRAEVGAVLMAERLAGALGFPLGLGVRGAGQVTGVLADIGDRTGSCSRTTRVASSWWPSRPSGRRPGSGGARPSRSRPEQCVPGSICAGLSGVWRGTAARCRSCWTTAER
jgi:hypothetical protein